MLILIIPLLLCSCYAIKLYKISNLGKQWSEPESGLRVMSYNIANARGNFPELLKYQPKETIVKNLFKIVRLIKQEKIDLACMNEVDLYNSRTYFIKQARFIAKRVGFEYIIEDKIFILRLPTSFDVGNAVISKYPLRINNVHRFGKNILERSWHVYKGFIDFDVLLKQGPMNFVFTHLEALKQSARCAEIRELVGYLKKKNHPYVLLGDFNTGPGAKCYKILKSSKLVFNPVDGLPTFRAIRPRSSVDHIFVSKGFHISGYHTAILDAADHRPIIADILWP